MAPADSPKMVTFDGSPPKFLMLRCTHCRAAISKIYKSHPDRLRDWLSQPKANGYQALHVTLMSKQGQWIEVQIRSDRMDEIAEQGLPPTGNTRTAMTTNILKTKPNSTSGFALSRKYWTIPSPTPWTSLMPSN